MKTIEEKAKAYDEAVTKSIEFYTLCKKCGAKGTVDFLEDIFPELKESEDERIRKGILSGLKYLETELGFDAVGDVDILDAYSWLEKQGEKPQGKTVLEAANEEKVDNVNKAEPKFHEGDWIVTDKDDTVQIGAVNKGYYTLNNGMDFCMSYVDRCWHLWTIEDAKAGDVLTTSTGTPFIYNGKYDMDMECIGAYCGLTELFGEDFVAEEDDDGWWCGNLNVHPATKEQRDVLMKAMADAGYTFDFEKKELKRTFNTDRIMNDKQDKNYF